jgi:hypothetical protein
MPLKIKVQKKDEIPAGLESAYVERDGVFVLDVEGGFVEKSRLEEFRTNNIALQNQLKSFEGIDAAKARELLAKQAELETGELIKKGDIKTLLERELAPIRAQTEAEKKKNAELQAKLDSSKLNDSLQSAGVKAGVRSSALKDLQLRASTAFRVVDGSVVAIEGVQTLDEWLEALKAEAPHLFEENSGGGAAGNGSGGAGLNANGKKNPWAKETWNLTEQGRITRENPKLANSLRAAAGR